MPIRQQVPMTFGLPSENIFQAWPHPQVHLHQLLVDRRIDEMLSVKYLVSCFASLVRLNQYTVLNSIKECVFDCPDCWLGSFFDLWLP
jgi:hypothetical protein